MGIFEGASNKDIAENLVISSKAVSSHIGSIFSKLQVADRAQIVIRARCRPRLDRQPLSRIDDLKYPSDMIGFNAICVQYVGRFV